MPKVDHLGYAVSNLDGKKDVMEDLLGFRFLERKVYERPGNTARLDFYEAEGAVMELVEMSNPDAPLNRFIAARGEGLHHICFVVDDLRATMAEWEAKGVEFTLAPTYGSRGGVITFTNAATTGGLAIELVQYVPEGEEISGWAQK